jgi:tryptophanyl-tRNA synthetase
MLSPEKKVFEQYEYQDYLITIQDYYGGPKLEAIAVPTKYAHLFNDLDDVYNCCEIFDYNNIVHEENVWSEEYQEFYSKDLIHVIGIDPDDTVVYLEGVKVESASAMLSHIVNEINWVLDLKPKTVVLKQIYKKSITPKSSKVQRGFNQVAWASMVKLRDKQCTKCSSVYDLHAHHIKSFKDNEELRYDLNNGITLCGQCHRKWHKENGR